MTLRCHFMLKSVCIVGLISFFCFTFGDNYVKTNEDTPILIIDKNVRSSLWWCTVYGDIR